MTPTAPPRPSLSLTIEQILQQAIAHHQAGGYKKRIRLYHSILQIQPHHAAANHNMGVLAAETKQLAAACHIFSLHLRPNPHMAHIGQVISAH